MSQKVTGGESVSFFEGGAEVFFITETAQGGNILDTVIARRKKLLGKEKAHIPQFQHEDSVCVGLDDGRDAEYHMNFGTVDNDDHGAGVELTMLSEVDELFQG